MQLIIIKFTVLIGILILTIQGCFIHKSNNNIKWNDKKGIVKISKNFELMKLYPTLKGKYTFCEIWNICKNSRIDSVLFEQLYMQKNGLQLEAFYFGTIQQITEINSAKTGTTFGRRYESDSLYYYDIYKWGRKLSCVKCDKPNEYNCDLAFVKFLEKKDLSRDSAYIHRALLRNNIEIKHPLPPAKNFNFLKWK